MWLPLSDVLISCEMRTLSCWSRSGRNFSAISLRRLDLCDLAKAIGLGIVRA
jgi:hypothetical protein